MNEFNYNSENKFLKELNHNNGGYKVPENYFENLPLEIMEKTSGSKRSKSAFWFWTSSFVVSSCLILFFLMVGLEKDVYNEYPLVVQEIVPDDVIFENLDEDDVIEFLVYETDY